MRVAIAVISLICLLATTLTWAADLHGVPPGDSQAGYQDDSGDQVPEPTQSARSCHLYHCQSVTHLTAAAQPEVYVSRPFLIAAAIQRQKTPGIIPSPWRPPTA